MVAHQYAEAINTEAPHNMRLSLSVLKKTRMELKAAALMKAICILPTYFSGLLCFPHSFKLLLYNILAFSMCFISHSSGQFISSVCFSHFHPSKHKMFRSLMTLFLFLVIFFSKLKKKGTKLSSAIILTYYSYGNDSATTPSAHCSYYQHRFDFE